MFLLRHKALLVISGLVWFFIGLLLLSKGLNFLMDSLTFHLSSNASYPLLKFLMPYFDSLDQSIVLLVALALLIGFFKGRFVLRKSAIAQIERIKNLPNPVQLAKIYQAKYFILIGIMMSLGILMNLLDVPKDIRGFIDVAVGAALINGSMFYFKEVPCSSEV